MISGICFTIAVLAGGYFLVDLYSDAHARQTGQSAGGIGWPAPIICIIALLLGIAAS